MRINSVALENFRNLKDVKAEFSPGVNVICGENAQGKTNLLEGVYFLSSGRSWRTRFDRDLINFGSDFAYINGDVSSRGRENKIDVRMGRGMKKKVLINGVNSKVSEMSGFLKTVIFSPDDLYLLREGAGGRRRFMDNAICQLRPKYDEYLTEYEKLLDHKTRILKDWEEKPDLLKVLPDFEYRMCQTGAYVIRYRAYFCERLRSMAESVHSDLTGGAEKIELEYKTVSTVRDPLGSAKDICSDLTEHLERHREAEKAARTCLSGPHKDDIEVRINSRSVRSFGSQGQVRTAALSLKMAELNLFTEDTGDAPVLLLDDVLSELDSKRSGYVVDRIKTGQVIITCCNDTLPGAPGKVMRMADGILTEE